MDNSNSHPMLTQVPLLLPGSAAKTVRLAYCQLGVPFVRTWQMCYCSAADKWGFWTCTVLCCRLHVTDRYRSLCSCSAPGPSSADYFLYNCLAVFDSLFPFCMWRIPDVWPEISLISCTWCTHLQLHCTHLQLHPWHFARRCITRHCRYINAPSAAGSGPPNWAWCHT